MPHLKLFSVSLLLFLSITVNAQQLVKGRVIAEDGEPLAFATVYEEGTTNGATSNADGYFQLTMENKANRVVCQYLGYGKQLLPAAEHLNFTLSPESFVLNEVIISAKDKDPAFFIIRQAIKMRKYYEEEVEAFSCDVYIKGLQRLDKKPKSLLGIAITVDTGIVYLSESISKYKFQRPDKISETMIASKLSGESNGFSYNRASEMLINLYQNSFFIPGLSERSFISPIASNAFLTYNYRLVGTVLEDTLLINKILVTPKRDTDPAFHGYIYIQENSWRIHSVDMMLTKQNGIEFVDSLKVFQVFAPTKEGIWMPLSQKFSYKFQAFGFKGSGVLNGVYSNYKVTPNPLVYKAPVSSKAVAIRAEPKPEPKKKKTKDKDFGNAVLKIEEEANEKDTLFWQNIRPVPLTPIEVKDYRVKDSLYIIKESEVYKDSLDGNKNKLKPANIFLSGYRYHWSYQERYLSFPSIIQLIQFNAVEGLAPELSVTYLQQKEQKTIFKVTPSLRYGFSNKRFQAQIEGLYTLDPKYHEYIAGGFGRYVFQYNESKSIPELANTIQTLFIGHTYMKLFQKSFVYAGYANDLADGLRWETKLEYAFREGMQNTTSFSFNPNLNITSNDPASYELPNTSFKSQTALIWSSRFTYTPGEKYIDRPNEKFNLGSRYPTFGLYYKKGIGGISNVNFDYLEGSIKKNFNLKIYGESNLHIIGGTFLNTKSLTFIDYHHFSGNRIFMRQFQGDRLFQLLDYYAFSTNDQFLEGHFEHHFNGFIVNKIPYMKRLRWQVVLSSNYLTTAALPNYTEVGLGVEHIFKFLRLDYFRAYNTKGHTQGFRIGAGF